MTHLTPPGFFIVGAPKCGTTTLYEWLGGHAQVHAPHKEPCFFSQDIHPTCGLDTHIPSLEAYLRIFATDPASSILSGEATPKYLYSDQALSQISALRQDARLIVCLRHPADLVISLHNQKLREGVETEQDFETAWLRGIDGKTGAPLSVKPEIDGQVNYQFWTRIGTRLQRLHDRFESRDIEIVLMSEMRKEPKQTYARVLKFLGLEDDGREHFAASNERARIRSLWLHRAARGLKREVQPVLGHIHRVRGGRGLGMLRALDRANMETGAYTSRVSDALRADISGPLANEIAMAEAFLGGRTLDG